MLGQRARRRTHCALCAPFKQLRQVSARSACVLRHTHAPPALRFSARAEGNPKRTSTRAIASLRSAPFRGRKRHALRKLGRAQRWPEWMSGCLDIRLPPLLAAPAAGRLRGGMGVGAPMLRELTRRSCLNEARQREVSSAAHPATDTPQVCPFAQRRGRRLGVAFLLGTFLWRSKEKYLARRGDSRASARNPGMRPNQRPKENTTKSIATSAYPTIASSQNHPKTPDTNRITRSHRAASDSSCVTITNAVP